ncbi:MAG: SDR family NAD(P)-dependent oxidoreductase [Acidimicrobiales bacterium]
MADDDVTRSLDGAVVAVVGATGVLGGALARLLVQRGAHVVACGRNTESLAGRDLGDAVTVSLDIRDDTAGDRLVAAALDRHGRLDGVVNAAGVVAFGGLVDLDDVAIEEVFLTNVVGPLWLLRRVIPHLEASSGFIAQISAVVAEQPTAGMVAYSASKAALTAVDVALVKELRRARIDVCDARPPHTETGLATRPLAGQAPRLPDGLAPESVAERIVVGIEAREREIPSSAFAG